ncbi:replication protein [Francisella philomiragia]|uniref:replication protein n=1 Tax=Francisella philomiragia TaxID=28110 RepID=UPI002243BDF1|nr:replication protein [Francisella philomiragia]
MKDKKFIPNSYQTPNAIVDELAPVLSDKAFKIYHIIVRKTLGWNKSKDYISTSQLMELSGTKKKDTIYKVIDELVHYHLVKKEKSHDPTKGNNYKIDFSHIEEAKNTPKPVPKKGTTTSTKKGDYQKTGLVPKNGTTLDPQNGTTTSTTKRDTQTNTIKHKEITTTTTIDMENIDTASQDEKSSSVSSCPFSFDEDKDSQVEDIDHERDCLRYSLIQLHLSEEQANTVTANYPLDIVEEAIQATEQANLEKRIDTTPPRYLYGILKNHKRTA